MREILFEQVSAVKTHLTQLYPQFELNVVPAMTYGNPSIQDVLAQVSAQPQEHVILFPCFPNIQPRRLHLYTMQWRNGWFNSAIYPV